MKTLYILVEGSSDETFFESKKIKTLFSRKNFALKIVPYQQKKKLFVKKFINAIRYNIPDADYIFARDLNSSPCVSAKKDQLVKKYNNLDGDRILIIKKCIEGWYLAGINDANLKKFKIRSALRNTENINKQQFKALVPKNYESIIHFMTEIIEQFSVTSAKKKNGSFNYFVTKLANKIS